MNLIPSDIVTRAARNGVQNVWVSERLLVSVLDGLTSSYLWKKARPEFIKTVPNSRKDQDILPDTKSAWRFAKFDGKFYYDFDRIPDKAPSNYRTQLGSKEQLLEAWELSKNSERQNALETVIKSALKSDWPAFLPHYAGLDAVQSESLAKAATLLNTALEYAQQKALDLRRFEFFSDLALIVERENLRYLPSNARRLKEKFIRLLGGEQVTEVVTLPRAGNANAKKFDDPQIMGWLITMRSSGMNTTNAYIARKIAQVCAMCEKNTPSQSWLEHTLSSPAVKQMTYTRYGAGGRKAMPYKAYVPMAGAVYAGDCWMMDATRVNFIEFTLNGYKWQHLMVCMVFDVHSGAIIGRSYGVAENRWMYTDALQMAATQAGYLPYEIIIDRFPGHNTPEWEAMTNKIQRGSGTRIEVTHIMTGKARLERAIDTVQMIGMQGSDKYYGQGIQSSREYAHRSEEALTDMRKRARAEGWNMEKAIVEAEKCFQLYNETKYSDYSRARRALEISPIEMHAESEKPHTYKAEWFELLHFFGLSKRIQVRNQGMIVTEINKVKYTYVIDAGHYEKMKHHAEVVMYYDLEDLNRVQLFTATDNPADEQFLCEATEQKAVQWAGPNRDGAAMGKAKSRIAAWRDAQEQDLQQHIENAEFSELALLGMTADKDTKEHSETAFYSERARQKRRKATVEIAVEEDFIPATSSIRNLY